MEAVRQGQWKLILPHKFELWEEELALYDLRRDSGERYNVKEQNPDVVERIQKLVGQACEDLGNDLTHRVGKNR